MNDRVKPFVGFRVPLETVMGQRLLHLRHRVSQGFKMAFVGITRRQPGSRTLQHLPGFQNVRHVPERNIGHGCAMIGTNFNQSIVLKQFQRLAHNVPAHAKAFRDMRLDQAL